MTVGVAFVALAAGVAHARGIAAEYAGAPGGSYTVGLFAPGIGIANSAVGMTFLSHADGSIDSLNLRMGWNTANPSNLTVSFFTLNASNLPDTLVGSRTVSQDDLSASVGGGTSGTVTIDFTTGTTAYLSSGVRYAFTVVSERTGNFDGGPNPPFGVNFDASGAQFAEGGAIFSPDGGFGWSNNPYPIVFQVNTTVPAPGGAAVMLAAMGLGLRRRR
jgi:hypothetical protein